MRRSRQIITDAERDHHWQVARTCLIEFQGMDEMSAGDLVLEARARLESRSRRPVVLFYHAEPFDTACRLTGKTVDVIPVLARYLEIRDRPDSEREGVKAG